MNRRFLCVVATALVLFACARASAQTKQSPLPAPTGYINDYAKVIYGGTAEQLETTLTKLDQQQQIQFAVVTVDSTNGQDIFDYSLAVARDWGLGAKDVKKPSLLLLIAVKDRKYFTQVSRHLEGDLPDGLVGQIQREKLVPAFREGDYGRGITDTINEYISVLAGKRGFSTDNLLLRPQTPRPAKNPPLSPFCKTLFIVVFLIGLILVISFVRRGGGGGGFGGFGGSSWWTWLLVSSLLNSGRGSRSGWSGGGFGGFGGGSSGGGGGFGGFGGGGDFGGGGSGGSW
jgi:uncharacterized protein